ncbi:MAG: radical SAM protein [Oscillospiraceae bacterium]|nr:radical SAM protein [Oscillospiraceae bacterium]
MTGIQLEQYLSDGVSAIIADALKAALSNPRESGFLLSFSKCAADAAKRRHAFEMAGEHIPPFLIMSITDDCNLHCPGCYARSNAARSRAGELPADEWSRLFDEAAGLGVSLILLAGGEPLMRRDVLEKAAGQKRILFPVFTNGTLWNAEYMRLFNKNRNLMPVISLEGGLTLTDKRRGSGVYGKLMETLRAFERQKLLFGVSVTVTNENLQLVTGEAFQAGLRDAGCSIVFFVEYVPVESDELALNDDGRAKLARRLQTLRARNKGQIMISFPGDESAGGCLAAGRGFFHINAIGGAEPCPFSPYSDTNIRGISLRDALRSPLFARLRESGLLNEKHIGGCALFEKKETVERLAKRR